MKILLSVLVCLAMLLNTGCSDDARSSHETIIARQNDTEEGLFYGELNNVMRNVFFDFIVTDPQRLTEKDGYRASEGYQLLCVTIEERNTFGETLPMFLADYQIQWGEGDSDFANPLTGLQDEQVMPDSFELNPDETVIYQVVFEVPQDITEFELVYLEEFADETVGDLFIVRFQV